MTPITERSENLTRMASDQQSILFVAFLRNSSLILTEPASGWAYQPIHFLKPRRRGSCMARTLPLHSLCIALTATALTTTAMSQGALGHEHVIEACVEKRWRIPNTRTASTLSDVIAGALRCNGTTRNLRGLSPTKHGSSPRKMIKLSAMCSR